jgi:hypothetical protein
MPILGVRAPSIIGGRAALAQSILLWACGSTAYTKIEEKMLQCQDNKITVEFVPIKYSKKINLVTMAKDIVREILVPEPGSQMILRAEIPIYHQDQPRISHSGKSELHLKNPRPYDDPSDSY